VPEVIALLNHHNSTIPPKRLMQTDCRLLQILVIFHRKITVPLYHQFANLLIRRYLDICINLSRFLHSVEDLILLSLCPGTLCATVLQLP